MATPGQLQTALAASLGYASGSVYQSATSLREAGLLTTGGRGQAAAQMGDTDAANLLIAMLAAETARSAAAVTKLTRETPLYERVGSIEAGPSARGRLAFPHAKSVGALIVALLDDTRNRRLRDIVITLDVQVGGGRVDLSARKASPDEGFDGEMDMLFIHTFESGRKVTRRRDSDERPVTAKRRTINRVGNGVFEDVVEILDRKD
ncbi:MAG: hypothetical protein AB7O44_29260 [Hyphomicrobiaceae bacterium]